MIGNFREEYEYKYEYEYEEIRSRTKSQPVICFLPILARARTRTRTRLHLSPDLKCEPFVDPSIECFQAVTGGLPGRLGGISLPEPLG